MNRYQFIALDEQRQLRMLHMHGRILHRRLKRGYTASLYQIENFYIEIWESVQGKVDNLVTHKDKTLLNFQFNLDENQELSRA